MEDVREAIGIDKVNMDGSTIFIEEHHKADANFVFHAITSHCMDNNIITCFVLFHNTFGHFHNVGMKFGYNLKKNSNVKVIEPFKSICNNISSENSDKLVCDNSSDLILTNKNTVFIEKLSRTIKEEWLMVKKETESQKVYLIIDDLSHLFDLGFNTEDVWLFLRYIRSFTNIEPHLTLCIGIHSYRHTQDLCSSNTIILGLQYSSELVIQVQPLETGYSQRASGKMIICWKSQHERFTFKWPEEMVYLFKLYDRHVKLFEPGSSYIT